MNILLVGLQSCGGSITAALLGQHPRSVVIPDTCNPARTGRGIRPGPLPKMERLAVKITVHGNESLHAYIAATTKTTNANRVVIVLRNPFCNYVSLRGKKYGTYLDQKFKELNSVIKTWTGEVVFYEDIAFRPLDLMKQFADWPLEISHFQLKRGIGDIMSVARQQLEWCQKYSKEWGPGNSHTGGIQHGRMFRDINPLDLEHVREIAPNLIKFYFSRRPEYAAFSPELTSY